VKPKKLHRILSGAFQDAEKNRKSAPLSLNICLMTPHSVFSILAKGAETECFFVRSCLLLQKE
jgi:hypothetical protein